jgi:hypothetical protein
LSSWIPVGKYLWTGALSGFYTLLIASESEHSYLAQKEAVVAVNYDKRIRAGLRYLSKVNSNVLKAGRLLARLNGSDAFAKIHVKSVSFVVEKTSYDAKLAQEQYQLLKTNQTTKQHFSRAVAALLIQVMNDVNGAADNLVEALQPETIRRARRGKRTRMLRVQPQYVLGTCYYNDGAMTCCNEPTCVLGLLGTWERDDC